MIAEPAQPFYQKTDWHSPNRGLLIIFCVIIEITENNVENFSGGFDDYLAVKHQLSADKEAEAAVIKQEKAKQEAEEFARQKTS